MKYGASIMDGHFEGGETIKEGEIFKFFRRERILIKTSIVNIEGVFCQNLRLQYLIRVREDLRRSLHQFYWKNTRSIHQIPKKSRKIRTKKNETEVNESQLFDRKFILYFFQIYVPKHNISNIYITSVFRNTNLTNF
jgi:hypothetical protein